MKIRSNQVGEMHHFYISFARGRFTIMNFLIERGYKIKEWIWDYTDETFPGGITHQRKNTFVALKPGEEPAEEKIYTAVFEKELKQLLSEV